MSRFTTPAILEKIMYWAVRVPGRGNYGKRIKIDEMWCPTLLCNTNLNQ
ncbi:hypothetical protein RJJ07_002473 [Salmonella enterica]|nr:hypothetical protein [Salmonella enterica]